MKYAKENWAGIVITAFIASVIIYVLCFGENIYIQVHDNLDSNVVWLKMLADNKLFWTHGTTAPFMGGLDRDYMYSEFKVYSWLYMLFPTFQAFIIGYLLRIIIAASGFGYVANVLFEEKNREVKNLFIFCGFLYGISPVIPTSGISFASLPWIFGILYRLYYTKKKKYYIALFFYPLVSIFGTMGIFICGYLFFFIVLDLIATRRFKSHMFLGLICLALGYICSEYRLFYTMFFSEVESVRTAFSTGVTLVQVLKDVISGVARGQYHSGTLHSYMIGPMCVICFIYNNIRYIREKRYREIYIDRVNWIVVWIVFNAVVYGINGWQPFKELIYMLLPQLSGFSFSRTLWFNSFLWHLCTAILLARIVKKKKAISYAICGIAFLVVCCCSATYNHLAMNLRYKWVEMQGKEVAALTYKEFYSQDLFELIKNDIEYNGEYSIAYGMHPAILEYNKIATLDGYFTNYPMEYKEKFREIIAPALEIDEASRAYYDNWGGRAYMFSPDISYEASKWMGTESSNLYIDIDSFIENEGTYIFSRVGIANADDLKIEFINRYRDEISPYEIFVYKIAEEE